MSELVTDYLEHAVSLRRRVAMRWHLFLCEACRRYYDQMRQTIGLLRLGRPSAADEITTDRILQATRRDPPSVP
jgi:hypothetical protein